MRHLRLFSVFASIVFVTTGCGPDNGSGGSAVNPAMSVSQDLETFTVEDEGGMPFMSRTLFFGFYKGLEKAEGENDRGTAEELRARLNLLMGLTPSNDGKSYVAARNPLDLLHHLINTDRIGTFNDGKRLMRDSVTSGAPADYNTAAKNATIRFTELEGRVGEDPAPDQIWVYPLLDWSSSFSQLGTRTATVCRGAQFIARQAAEEDATEIESEFWEGCFAGDSFSATGHNEPERSLFSITGRQFGNLEFWQTFLGSQHYDTLFLTDTNGITIDGEEPVFLCIQINYSVSQVSVTYVTDPEADTVGSNPDPSQCPDVGTSFTYDSEPVDERRQ
jgi:hypothetical protein